MQRTLIYSNTLNTNAKYSTVHNILQLNCKGTFQSSNKYGLKKYFISIILWTIEQITINLSYVDSR